MAQCAYTSGCGPGEVYKRTQGEFEMKIGLRITGNGHPFDQCLFFRKPPECGIPFFLVISITHCIANTYQEHQTFQILANSTGKASNLEHNKS